MGEWIIGREDVYANVRRDNCFIRLKAKVGRGGGGGGGAEHNVPEFDVIMRDYLFKAPNPSHEGKITQTDPSPV